MLGTPGDDSGDLCRGGRDLMKIIAKMRRTFLFSFLLFFLFYFFISLSFLLDSECNYFSLSFRSLLEKLLPRREHGPGDALGSSLGEGGRFRRRRRLFFFVAALGRQRRAGASHCAQCGFGLRGRLRLGRDAALAGRRLLFASVVGAVAWFLVLVLVVVF